VAQRALSPESRRASARRGLELRAIALVAIGLGLLATPAVASNGAKLTAYGVRAAGRGGVDYAFADDATGPATNPAGMGFIPNRIDQTWLAALADSDYKNQFGDWHMAPSWAIPVPAYSFGVVFDPSQSWHVGDLFDMGNWGLKHGAKDPPEEQWERGSPELRVETFADDVSPSKGKNVPGASVPGTSVPRAAAEPSEEEMFGGPFRIGFGIFPVKGGSFSFAHIQTPFWRPGAPEYTTTAQELAITPSIGYRFGSHFSIGLAPQLHYATLKLTSPIEQPRSLLAPEFQTASTLVNSTTVNTLANSHDLTTFGWSFRAGAMFTIPELSIGVVYQEKTHLQDYIGGADVDSQVQINKLTLGSPGVLSIIDGRINPNQGFHSQYNMRVQNQQSPRQVGLGIALHPIPRISLGMDYTFIKWSEVMRVLSVRLTDATNSNLNVLTSPSIHVKVPLEWRDQHVIAVGGSFVVLQGDDIVPDEPSYRLILRAGYNWAQRPFSASNALPQTPLLFEHHASAGMTFQWGPYLDFSVAWEHAFFSSIHTGINKSDSDLSFSHQTAYLDTFYAGLGANF
jgi:long-subunit fatty acid transport protein